MVILHMPRLSHLCLSAFKPGYKKNQLLINSEMINPPDVDITESGRDIYGAMMVVKDVSGE